MTFEACALSLGGSMIEFESGVVGPPFAGGLKHEVRDTTKRHLSPRRTLIQKYSQPATAL